MTGQYVMPSTGSVVQSSAERRTSVMLPLIWENLMISASWAGAAMMTICCWPLRVVVSPPAPGLGAGVSAPDGAGGGGRSVPRTWRPWASTLTVAWL
jgi:hypothetical protein